MTDLSHPYIVSACLMGLCTRYDGKLKKNTACCSRLKNSLWIPVCPEQLGGLPTPREAADIRGGNGHDVLDGSARVLSKSGADFSAQFLSGAHQVLAIAQAQNIQSIILKSGSPSCAVNGTIGVTAALLQQHGFHLEEY
ncbi:MAG: DUF523 domain-containing protein [Desulfopila sp.]|nr:DUF523 domain-containing protein [Desulfopila sp.]